jgi:mRNA interferase MazF
MKVRRGDVVLVDFPFADGVGAKLRPAVVVQNNKNIARLKTTALAPITTNLRHQEEATQVVLDPTTVEGQLSGVLMPSVIKCESIANAELSLIHRKIGVLSANHITKLNDALKAAFDIM